MDTHFDKHLGPFGEPKTFPAAWDLSSIYPSISPAPFAKSNPMDPNGDQPGTQLQNPNGKQQVEGHPEKFTDPTTPPANWDVSALV